MVHVLDKINQSKEYNNIHKSIISDLYDGENLVILQNRRCFVSTILAIFCLNKIRENNNIIIRYETGMKGLTDMFYDTVKIYAPLFNLDDNIIGNNFYADKSPIKCDICIFDGMWENCSAFLWFFNIDAPQKIFVARSLMAVNEMKTLGDIYHYKYHTHQADSIYTKEELAQFRKSYDTSIHDDWNECDYLRDFGDLNKDHSLPREAYHRGTPELDDYMASL